MDVYVLCSCNSDGTYKLVVYIYGEKEPALTVEQGSANDLEETFEYLTEAYGEDIYIDQQK